MLFTDAELEARTTAVGRERDAQRSVEPAGFQVVARHRRPERARTPVREHVQDVPEPLAVLGQLVDPRRRRWLELSPADDAALLERLQARREDVRSAARQPRVEVRVAKRTLVEQLANDEQRPALADEVEGVRDRAVLVVTLGHERSVAA